MSKDDIFTVDGVVTEVLPNALFKVRLENNIEILCHLKGKMRMNNINVRLMDRVTLEISSYDPTKGRITRRHKPETTRNQ